MRDLVTPSSFLLPYRSSVGSGWAEHAPFAFWLIEAMRPKMFVELGTHTGYSFAAFCQAVHELKLEMKCFAVDTWRGDEHAGFYGEEVFDDLKKYIESRYGNFARLIRSTFDEALGHFDDGTIDLLHIDGRHFFEDVSYDYRTWQGKLAPNAVVLFHDINVRERGFGVYRLWENLKAANPHFEFLHGNGLGVLGMGKQFSVPLQELFQLSDDDGQQVRAIYSRLGKSVSDHFENETRVTSERKLLNELKKSEEVASSLKSEIVRRDVQLAAQVAETQDWQRQLVQRNEEYAAISSEKEASFALELQRLQDELNRRDVQLTAQVAETQDWQRQLVQRNEEYAAISAEAAAIYFSSSWRLTGPLRGIASRHAGTIAVVRGFSRRHPWLRRVIVRSVRLFWRILTLRFIRSTSAARPSLPQIEPQPESQPTLFKFQPISPLVPAPAPALALGGRRRLICFGHVLSYPPRAGNEYRIHRLLSWLSQQGWEVLFVVCPLPHEMPSAQQLASAAAVYPKLIVVDRAGVIYHNLTDYSELLGAFPRRPSMDIPRLLKEDSGGDPANARLINVLTTFCPDVLVELLVQLQEVYRPDLLLAEYVFMTRAFGLMKPVTKAIDTHDVFSTKASKVEKYGVSDGLTMSEAEEAALLRRADILIGIQPDEARDLTRLAPDRRVVSVGVDFQLSEPQQALPAGMTVFLVASGNLMNVKGLRDFLRFCWPMIHRNVPEAELLIAGAVGDTIEDLPPNVRVLGRVEDLRPLYAGARLVINPTVAGTGLKIKTIEALCHLRPVVCWPSGVDGVADAARAFCHIATDWFTFAQHVTRLLQVDPEAIAVDRGREALKLAFSPESVYSMLDEALHAA